MRYITGCLWKNFGEGLDYRVMDVQEMFFMKLQLVSIVFHFVSFAKHMNQWAGK